jgi:polysaccharide pyruvyl transferase WcaK-like protein
MTGKCLVIAGEVFSPNLGDGIIFETMRDLYQQVDASVKVIPLDISGRHAWETPRSTDITKLKSITLARRWINRFYSLFNYARLTLKFHNSLRQRWSEQIAQADLVVIGGGQLLMDDDLDFPTKLNQLGRLVKENDLPLHLSACGVGANWSKQGKRLVEEVLSQAASITVRDSISQQRLDNIFPGHIAERSADPAIWAAELYGKAPENGSKTLGLGVLNPADVNLRNPGHRLASGELEDFWLELFTCLDLLNVEYELFSNGNLADAAFSRRLVSLARKRKGLHVCIAPRPSSPQELAVRVRAYGGVIAFRLHAALLAITFGLPCVGLGWDKKIPALFDELQMTANCFSYEDWQAESVANKIVEQMKFGVVYHQIGRMKALALRNVQIVLAGGIGR